MKILFAESEEQLCKCWKAIQTLRPHLKAEEFTEKCKLLLSEGAKIIFVDEGDTSPAVSVFRTNYYFHRGKNIYVDDLSTLPESRGKGYASALLDFIIDYAKQNNCENIHLDSGYMLERRDAHRLYLNKGFYLASHHFVLDLKK